LPPESDNSPGCENSNVDFSFCGICIFALAGCEEAVFDNKKTPAPVAETYSKKLRIEKPNEPSSAPDFTLEDLSGRSVSLEDFKGKVVFLNFWATWCPPCVLEMPSMEKLHNEFAKEGLVMLALNFRENRDQVKAFVKEHKLSFTVLMDPEGTVFELYQVWGLPVTTIINRRHEIVGRAMGIREWYSKESREFFSRLLAEKS
jgi:peroxiredoxin